MKVVPITTELIEILHERHPEIFHRPKRPWVGLTDEENRICLGFNKVLGLQYQEAKLKEKNT